MRSTLLAWAAAFSVTGAVALRAQGSRPEVIGSRVRVTVAGDSVTPARVLVGKLVAVGDSALLIQPLVIRPPEIEMEERVPTSRIQRFEVSTGKDRRAGASFGALIGLMGGLALGLALGDDCSSSDFICFDRSETGAGGALIGAALGMWAGVIVGRGDRWVPAAVPSRMSVIPTSGGGVTLAASFSF